MSAAGPQRGLVAGFIGLALVCGLAGLYAAHPLYAVDLFWHLKLGEVIVRTGHIPTTDLFSAVTPDAPYVQFNWLWDVFAFTLADALGLGALRVAQALLMAATLGGLYAWSWKRSREPALALALSAFALVLVEDRFQARPDALTLSFVVACLPLWAGGVRRLRPVGLLLLALAASLWTNLHGGASLLLPLTLGALAVGTWIEPAGAESAAARRSSGIALLVVICVQLSAPGLLAGLLDWTRAIGPQLSEGNEEWLPTYTMLRTGGGLSRYLIAFAPTLVSVVYVLEQRQRLRGGETTARALCGEWLLCGGLLALSQQAVRNAFLCVVPLAFVLLRRTAGGLERRQRVAFAASGLLLCALSFEDAVLDSYGGLRTFGEQLGFDVHPDRQPLHLGAFVAESGIEGGVLNDGRWGGYLIYKGWPRLSVLADSRHHFTPEVLSMFRVSQDALGRAVLAEHGFRRFGLELTAFSDPTFAGRIPPGWVLLFKAGPEELYQRLDGAHAAANIARARAWLARRGAAPKDGSIAALERALRARGGAEWLQARRQTQRLDDARRLSRSASTAEQAVGEGRLGVLYFHADRPRDALEHLMRQAALDPSDPRPALYAALSHLDAGAPALARSELARVEQLGEVRLSVLQRQRLYGLRQRLQHAEPR